MYLGFLVDLARLGHIPFERAGFPGSSRLRPLYESFPNRTGGKGAHPPIRPGIRDIYDSSATMEMMWYMRDRILTSNRPGHRSFRSSFLEETGGS
ncbi:hypothetical protein NSND_50242 [Nitrospira sp. ND1]|nr:hypothetical protein NSND_50242 [Nitrospira sp. ND1]